MTMWLKVFVEAGIVEKALIYDNYLSADVDRLWHYVMILFRVYTVQGLIKTF